MALSDNLTSYYKLDENAANTTVEDSKGNKTGTSTTNTSNLSVTGKINTAFDFAGADNIALPANIFSNPTEVSINFWAKANNATSNYFLVNFNDSTGAPWINVSYNSLNSIRGRIYDGSAGEIISNNFTSTDILMITLTAKEGDRVDFYINGNLEGSNTSFGTFTQIATNANKIGSNRVGGQELDGWMDEFGIWDRKLTQTEITELYNSGSGLAFPFPTTGTNLQINIGDVWKEIPAVQINIGDTWKEVVSIQQNIGDTWKSVF